MEKAVAAITKGIFLAVLTVLCVIAGGFVIHSLWGWFLVPIGVPMLEGYAHAIGVGLFVHLVTTRVTLATKDIGSYVLWVCHDSGVWYLIVYGYGALLHALM